MIWNIHVEHAADAAYETHTVRVDLPAEWADRFKAGFRSYGSLAELEFGSPPPATLEWVGAEAARRLAGATPPSSQGQAMAWLDRLADRLAQDTSTLLGGRARRLVTPAGRLPEHDPR